jgi:hypothetical protein
VIAIDTAVLDLTEAFCQKLQRASGRTNVWLAVQLTNLSVILYFAWALIYFPALPLSRWARVAVALFCGGVLYILSQTVFRVSIETSEMNAYHRVAKGLRNPRRLRDAPLRLAFLTLSLLLALLALSLRVWFPAVLDYLTLPRPPLLLGYPVVLLTTVVLYVLACDPLPPCTGWLTEWVRRLVPSRAAAHENLPSS